MRPPALRQRAFLWHTEDADGYPNLAFEHFYQQGMSCYQWRLPARLKRQAFRKACAAWQASGQVVAMWQIRAFVYGAAGQDCHGRRERRASVGFQWPAPPDPSWELVVCVYPDGFCDLDLVHSVSRAFWSEHHGFFPSPSEDAALLNAAWYDRMGFQTLRMQPLLRVTATPRRPHLRLVKS